MEFDRNDPTMFTILWRFSLLVIIQRRLREADIHSDHIATGLDRFKKMFLKSQVL